MKNALDLKTKLSDDVKIVREQSLAFRGLVKFANIKFYGSQHQKLRSEFQNQADASTIKGLIDGSKHEEKQYHLRRQQEKTLKAEILESPGKRGPFKLDLKWIGIIALAIIAALYLQANPELSATIELNLAQYGLQILGAATLIIIVFIAVVFRRRRKNET